MLGPLWDTEPALQAEHLHGYLASASTIRLWETETEPMGIVSDASWMNPQPLLKK